MTVTALTGKVGSGKNLFAIMRIMQYAFQGRRVVCNFRVDLKPVRPLLHRLFNKPAPEVECIPGRPTYADVKALGKGGPREHRAGLLVLDEVGPLLNARTWQDKDRQQFIDWMLHSRKLAWDLLLIVQNIALVDKQIRVAVIESMITCKRLDRLKMLGLPLPRVHIAIERYGTEPQAPMSERTVYRGTRFFKCYDTTELVGEVQDDQEAATATPEVMTDPDGTIAVVSPEPVRPRLVRDFYEWRRFGWQV